MKKLILGFTTGLASLVLLSGCGEKAPTEAELKSELAEVFDMGAAANPTGVQQAAQEVVELMDAGQYGSAVRPLHNLMTAPGLTPAQRRAVGNTMAEVQQRLATDANLPDEQRREAQEAVDRTTGQQRR